ncbi:MAG: GIY-YIG nuclease superfamily protein [candidate division WS2 bacterium ADurb.Bin280]|uniref:GIY-YIG nuclease superfamily protein n=1 Tax=candidate division WS2 bacterium ADurb.Bin280 TaxID=1852829 RepID=A0A1V5SDE5_9BACT|nr:MAG: GIY-YIG nuclease superfamily protein [candidate division WS2 bacterium ADurb.Bin280]
MFYVYVIRRTAKRVLYIGFTTDLRKRIEQHSEKYLTELIYYEAYVDERLARNRELKLKFYGSAWRGLKKRINLA